MKKIGFFNTWALYIGGTYISAFENEVVHEHYRLCIRKFRLVCEHTHTERYRKDGKVIITDFYDDGKSRVMKGNYLDYNYEFKRFPKYEIIENLS